MLKNNRDQFQNVLNSFKEFNISDYLKIFMVNNHSNALPYHNFYHSIVVTDAIIEYVTYCLKYDNKPNVEQYRLLLIAALFHDFNHSGGVHDDEWNINQAKSDISLIMLEQGENEGDVMTVCSLIDATRYPYTIENEDLTPFQAALRSADLLMIDQDNYFQTIIMGLSNEANLQSELPNVILRSFEFYEKATLPCSFFNTFEHEQLMKSHLGTLKGYHELFKT